MARTEPNSAGNAWYSANRTKFAASDQSAIVAELSSAASAQGWHIEPQQHEEWDASVGILQDDIRARVSREVEILQNALWEAQLTSYTDVILEYDFRRRGLRMDCVLLAPGLIAVLEFKRSKLTPADADQVTNYCVNLVEFHEETQRLCRDDRFIVVPILVQTEGASSVPVDGPREFHAAPWECVLRRPLHSDRDSLGSALSSALGMRDSDAVPDRNRWLRSKFAPSSTILDAAISLFGDHDVSAIREHAGSIENIEDTVADVAAQIEEAQQTGRNRIIFVSGAPGSGKTLVGLRLAFDARFRDDAVFVTGNAPLVDVLTEALKRSYRRRTAHSNGAISGYPRNSARLVIENSTFKLVKAHNFLGKRGQETASADGRIVVFDEAQRTYEMGRQVVGDRLKDHEADLILETMERSYGSGAVVVALLGHNQAINRGERGAIAWLEAAERRGWEFAVANTTLLQSEFNGNDRWSVHPLRIEMHRGHLSQSLRFYRNQDLESWAHLVMENRPDEAKLVGRRLSEEGHQVWLTRSLPVAREWARRFRVGDERAGLIASGQARRLAAEGLFVDLKPPIAHWMLAPNGDPRSSNMLETVQNQYQIQGLELDYTIVCWDADLRRYRRDWASWRMHGDRWKRDNDLAVAKNGYRVLLTRARKGMTIFVPDGDQTEQDPTRAPRFYNEIAEYLLDCGAEEWVGSKD